MSDDSPKTFERLLENAIFASRWLMAPFYFGLGLSIVIVLIKFMAEFFHLAAHALTASEADVILGNPGFGRSDADGLAADHRDLLGV